MNIFKSKNNIMLCIDMTKDYKCTAGQTLSARGNEEDEENVYDYLDNINMSNDEWLRFDKGKEAGDAVR